MGKSELGRGKRPSAIGTQAARGARGLLIAVDQTPSALHPRPSALPPLALWPFRYLVFDSAHPRSQARIAGCLPACAPPRHLARGVRWRTGLHRRRICLNRRRTRPSRWRWRAVRHRSPMLRHERSLLRHHCARARWRSPRLRHTHTLRKAGPSRWRRAGTQTKSHTPSLRPKAMSCQLIRTRSPGRTDR
jgi:hypothetical protein